MDRRRSFGANLRRGLGVLGRGIGRFAKGALGVIGSPIVGTIASAINPALAPAALAAGSAARIAKRGIEAIESRDHKDFAEVAGEAIRQGRKIRSDLGSGVDVARHYKRQRRR